MIDHPPDIKTQPIADARIPYLEYEGAGPPVVLLHATGFLPWLWHPIARMLAPAHRVIAPFFCNHRLAAPQDGGLAWRQLADDLQQLCGALSVDTPLLVGHSMGGTVATLSHAVCGVAALKMVLIEPIYLPEEIYQAPLTLAQHPLAAKAIRRRNFWRDRREVRADFQSKPFFQSWDERVLNLYIAHGTCDTDGNGVQLTCAPEREASLFMGGTHFNPWPVLPRVGCPTLVLEGERSENRHRIDLRRASALIPQGRHVIVTDAGHLVPMEQPETTARLIMQFMDEQ